MEALLFNGWAKGNFPSVLCIRVSCDEFLVGYQASPEGLVKTLMKLVLQIIGFVVGLCVCIDQAVVGELALNS